MQVISTVIGSHTSTARMRQLAQTEVDWTTFRSVVVPGPHTCTDPAVERLFLPDLADNASSLSLAGCSPRAANLAGLTPRSGYLSCSSRSPRSQDRPYTAPTVVSRQPLLSGTECPLHVSSLYKSNQQAKAGVQAVMHANPVQSVHSMAADGIFASGPALDSTVSPQPFLKSRSGGIALTFGSRQHDRPDSSSSQILAELPVKGGKRSHKTIELMRIMREGRQLSEQPKVSSLIVIRSNAWPASPDAHPPGSGLTVRQQACLLGTSSLAKTEKKLAEKYGPWLQDLKSVASCSPAVVPRSRAQADTMATMPDAALAPRLYSMGPI